MTKITWLGEDGPGVAGPSFTTCFGRKFPKGEAIEMADPEAIKRAKGNPYFSVEAGEAPKVQAVAAEEPPHEEPAEDDLKGLTIAELRNMADASGIDHHGLSKADLREAILAHDRKPDVQDPH